MVSKSSIVALHNFWFVSLAKLNWHPVLFRMTSVCLSYIPCFSKAVLFCSVLIRVKLFLFYCPCNVCVRQQLNYWCYHEEIYSLAHLSGQKVQK